MAIKIGQPGHVCFQLLAPRIERTESRTRYNEAGKLERYDVEFMTAETFPTGETACHLAYVCGVNPDGTVNAGGWTTGGRPFSWVNVLVGDKPVAADPDPELGAVDPAGHVFHATCPYGR